MNSFNHVQVYPLLLLIVGFLSACETTQVDVNGGESTAPTANPYESPVASKLFSNADSVYGTDTLYDASGLPWVLHFLGADTLGNGTTRFTYNLNKPSGGSGTHFSYRLPACAAYVDGSASPTPGINGNANGDLEWGPSDLADGPNSVSLDFYNSAGRDSVIWGVAQIGLKTPGTGSNQLEGEIVGPCRGRLTISGTVFLNDNSPEYGAPNDIQDGNEPGLADVEVTLEQSFDGTTWSIDKSSGIHLSSDIPGVFGSYLFDVVLPPVVGAPSQYRVRISKSAETAYGINDALFNPNIFQVACVSSCPDMTDPTQITKLVDVSDPDSVDFGFEVKVKTAIAAFDTYLLFSDGRDRAFWNSIATQKSVKGQAPEYDLTTFSSFLNCSSAPSIDPTPSGAPDTYCIYDPSGVSEDFGGDVDDLIIQVFGLDGISVAEAAAILKNDSNGDLQEALRTQLLAALLNFTTGRGICEGNLGGDGRCLSWDEPAMRSVIQNALVVLVKSGYGTVQKASSGSVSTNTDLLSRAN